MKVRYYANDKGYHIEGGDGLRVTMSGPGNLKSYMTMAHNEIQDLYPGAQISFTPLLKHKLDEHLRNRTDKWK